MKKFTIILLASISVISCNVISGNVISGNGNVREENRNVPEFNTVRSSGSIDVEIKMGDAYSVLVENDENLLPYVITNVDNGVLSIRYKDNYSINNDHAKVTVTAPSLNKIITSGSGNIEAIGTIKNASNIDFSLSGSGDVEADVDAPSIKVSGSGSGNLKLSGRTKDFDCKMSGSGDVNCPNLKSENANIKISGSGNARVFASVSITGRSSGSGDIRYSGNPQTTDVHASGSGSIEAQK